MTTNFRPGLLLAAPLLLLAACGDDAGVTVEDDGREATGEVLEGSISDAMLPVDQVRSQPPLLEDAPEGSGITAPAADSEPDAEPAAADAAEEPAEASGE